MVNQIERENRHCSWLYHHEISKVQLKYIMKESNKHKFYRQPFHAVVSKRINGCNSNSNHRKHLLYQILKQVVDSI